MKLSTEGVAKNQVFDYWKNYICDVFVNLEASQIQNKSFFGSIESQSISSIQFSEVEAAAQVVNRTYRNIRQASDDFFLLSVQLKGEGIISQDGRHAVLRQGDMCLYDSVRPYQLQFDNDFKQLVVKIPRKHIRSLLPISDKVTATLIGTQFGTGNILLNYINNLHHQSQHITTHANHNLEHITSLLLVDALVGRAPDFESASSRAVMLMRIKQWIEQNLNDASISVSRIATSLNCSRRLIYLCFEEEQTTPHQYIVTQRLNHAFTYLQNPIYSSMSISEIADVCGFKNPSHFSTLFKKMKGISPRDFRRIT